MSTQYHPLLRHSKLKWLLSDGRIVEEPHLEESESGRRVRVMGTTKSVYPKDLNDLIFRSVQQTATKLDERIWMRIVNDDPIQELDNEFGAATKAGKPHFMTEAASRMGRSSEVTWTFRHETLPIAARITVYMEQPYRGYRQQPSTEQNVTVKVNFPSTHPDDAHHRVWVEASRESEFTFSEHGGEVQQQQNYIDWLRDNRPEWLDVLGSDTFGNEREAAAGVARIVRELEEFDEVCIPDLRDPAEPSWLTLKLHSTSYSRDFGESLVDFINGQPIVEQISEHWSAIVNLLRRSGIVVSDLEDSELHSLLAGTTDSVKVTTRNVSAPNEQGGSDPQHVVGFNLATGTITVACSHRDATPEATATEYEIARIKAEARGELDSFLGFQANIMNGQHESRFKRTVKQRSVETDDLDELLGLAGQQ